MNDRPTVTLDPESAALVDNLPKEITPMRKLAPPSPPVGHENQNRSKRTTVVSKRTLRGLKPYQRKPISTEAERSRAEAAQLKRVARQLKRLERKK